MPLAFTISSLAGAVVRMHILLPVFFVWLLLTVDPSVSEQLHEISLLLALFALAIHEAVHFAFAKFAGLKLLEARLYPFGARYRFREEPSPLNQFLFFILPASVNAIIAAGLFGFLGSSTAYPLGYCLGSFAFYNLVLAVLNICPCSPLDGGSVLLALLKKEDVKHPGRLLSRVSQVFCFSLAVVAFFVSTPIAVGLAITLLLNSFKDKMEERIVSNAEGLTAQSAYIPFASVKSFPHNYTISRALVEASVSAQEIFPVFYEAKLVGFITRGLLLEEAAADADERYLTEVVIKEDMTISPVTPLATVVEILTQEDMTLLVVAQDEQPLGFILKEVVLNFLVVRGIQRENREVAEHDSDFMS